jgi:hypothetical protein
MSDLQAVTVMLRDDDMVKDQLERPGFDQAKRNLRE